MWVENIQAGREHLDTGHADQAENDFLNALKLSDRMQESPLTRVVTLKWLATAQQRRGRFDEATLSLGSALDSAEQIGASGSYQAVSILAMLSQAYAGNDRFPEAAEACIRAVQMCRLRRMDCADVVGTLLSNAGTYYLKAGAIDDAYRVLFDALDVQESRQPPDQHGASRTLLMLAELDHRTGQNARAEGRVRRAVQISETQASDNGNLVLALSKMAAILIDRNSHAAAEDALKRAMALADTEADAGRRQMLHGILAHTYGVLRYSERKFAAAAQYFYSAQLAWEKRPQAHHRDLINAIVSRAHALHQCGRRDEAFAVYEAAASLLSEMEDREISAAAAAHLSDFVKLLRKSGRKREAEELKRRIASINQNQPHRREADAIVDVRTLATR